MPTLPKPSIRVSLDDRGDVFVTKFSPDGKSLVYSTVLGGTLLDAPGDIAVNPAGEAFVVGQARIGFPVIGNTSSQRGNGDGFAVKLNANGTVAWSRLVGGNGADNLLGLFPLWTKRQESLWSRWSCPKDRLRPQ